jgi:peptide/nickel transport system ATP-binding protein
MLAISEIGEKMSENSVLSVNNLKKYFYTQQGVVKAIDGIDFSLNAGETLGLVGESGSGKSTVAYALVGMYKPTEGKCVYKNQDIGIESRFRNKEMKRDIQIVFQDPGTSLNSRRTIRQILELPIKIHGMEKNGKARLQKVRELLELVHLPEDYINKYPKMIGGGEKQMISIARALATNPSLVLLDEPTSALDVSTQSKIIRMLRGFQRDFKLTYLFITHDLSLMSYVATKVAIMYLGKICEIAPKDNFFKDQLHPYTKMLLSAIPVISEEEERMKPEKIQSKGEIPSAINIPKGCSFYSRCSKKMDICSHQDPEMIEVREEHSVRCHLYNQ